MGRQPAGGAHLGHVVLAGLAQVVVQAPVLDAALLLRAELVAAARPVVGALDVRQQAHEHACLAGAHVRAVRGALRLHRHGLSDPETAEAFTENSCTLLGCCMHAVPCHTPKASAVHHPLRNLINYPAQAMFLIQHLATCLLCTLCVLQAWLREG